MSSKANDQRLLYGRGGEHCLCRPDLQKSTQEKHHPGSPGRKENIHFMGQGGRFDSASSTSRWAGLDLLSHRLEPRAGTAAALPVTLGCAGARAVQSHCWGGWRGQEHQTGHCTRASERALFWACHPAVPAEHHTPSLLTFH